MVHDIVGKTFNRLTGVKRTAPRNGSSFALFKCTCGNEVETFVWPVVHGRTKSCGCLRTEVQKGRKRQPYKDPRHVALTLAFNATRQGAVSRKLSFEITRSDFEKIVAQSCHYCGLPPSNTWHFRGKLYAYSGIDRVDNTIGYVPSNCVPSCAQCNRAKGVLSAQEFEAWIDRVVQHKKHEEKGISP